MVNTYDEYGNPGSTNEGRFQYTEQVWLPELEMYYYKARIYSPKLFWAEKTTGCTFMGHSSLSYARKSTSTHERFPILLVPIILLASSCGVMEECRSLSDSDLAAILKEKERELGLDTTTQGNLKVVDLPVPDALHGDIAVFARDYFDTQSGKELYRVIIHADCEVQVSAPAPR